MIIEPESNYYCSVQGYLVLLHSAHRVELLAALNALRYYADIRPLESIKGASHHYDAFLLLTETGAVALKIEQGYMEIPALIYDEDFNLIQLREDLLSSLKKQHEDVRENGGRVREQMSRLKDQRVHLNKIENDLLERIEELESHE